MTQDRFICLAGKNNIAVNVLRYLLQNRNMDYKIGIVCNRTETGIDGWQKSFRKYAKTMGIPEYSLEEMYEMENLVFISLEFDQIVKPECFRSARLYNIHFSLLPAYKGMYTAAIPLINGEKKTGVTFHCIDAGIDTGDIIKQKEFSIEASYTVRDVYKCYIKYGTELVLECIDDVIRGNVNATKQPATGSSYYSRKAIDYKNLHIDLMQTAEKIANQIRAFNFREYQMPKVYDEAIIDTLILDTATRKKPGTILEKSEAGMVISTIDYDIVLYYDRFGECMEACACGNLHIVQEICKVRKHISERSDEGWTPLIVATYHGNMEVVKYLISIGADIHDKNYNGTNLLMYAKEVFLRDGNTELFQMLYDMGLDVEENDDYGKNVIDYLKEDGYKLKDIIPDNYI